MQLLEAVMVSSCLGGRSVERESWSLMAAIERKERSVMAVVLR